MYCILYLCYILDSYIDQIWYRLMVGYYSYAMMYCILYLCYIIDSYIDEIWYREVLEKVLDTRWQISHVIKVV